MKKTPSLALVLGTACTWGLMTETAVAVDDADFRFDTSSNLYEVCSVAPDAPEYVVANQACRAFIEASVQYHDEIADRKRMKQLICYPKTATIADGKAAFVSWASAHSGDKKLMAEQPVVGVVRALAAKYPCSK
ncbi:hypothetical protein G3480_17160 [Thiorhodococcus mannitoliphagus]|uniref:Rap1a immunity protein domain-containing protein n=1 Tax=Thiorhodococcus mannitoliphagus TaxID=329406 RepID=A0A6P1DY54_9GAMM|nr:Rap1a/Tai family immunity protein [Thiorhodococcus mannitoliphagus]NEX22013.1 hypothetical protein [Thiorhodococcus mannitoliphagus]